MKIKVFSFEMSENEIKTIAEFLSDEISPGVDLGGFADGFSTLLSELKKKVEENENGD